MKTSVTYVYNNLMRLLYCGVWTLPRFTYITHLVSCVIFVISQSADIVLMYWFTRIYSSSKSKSTLGHNATKKNLLFCKSIFSKPRLNN